MGFVPVHYFYAFCFVIRDFLFCLAIRYFFNFNMNMPVVFDYVCSHSDVCSHGAMCELYLAGKVVMHCWNLWSSPDATKTLTIIYVEL